MGLLFTNAADQHVECSSAVSLEGFTAFTVWAWVFPMAAPDGAIDRIFSRNLRYFCESNVAASSYRIQVNCATTNAVAQGAANTLIVGQWEFAVATYDETDGPRIFKGTLAMPVAEIA